MALASLITADRRRVLDSSKASPTSYRLFEMLPMMPRLTVEQVRKKLEGRGIAVELIGQKKNRSYAISHILS